MTFTLKFHSETLDDTLVEVEIDVFHETERKGYYAGMSTLDYRVIEITPKVVFDIGKPEFWRFKAEVQAEFDKKQSEIMHSLKDDQD